METSGIRVYVVPRTLMDMTSAEQAALAALHIERLTRDPAFQTELRAAEEAAAAGFPDARPGEEVLAELRRHLSDRPRQA